jgi:hypothetical protein
MITNPSAVQAAPQEPDPTVGMADNYTVEVEEANPQKQAEEVEVKKFFECFKEAREFDKNTRLQITKDRQYASGAALIAWAVSTNIIGAMIDILTAALYARDPDLSARKAAWVDQQQEDPITGQMVTVPSIKAREMELFARTLELVVSKMWKRARLKKRMRRIVRAVLSVGQGWLKVLPYGSKGQDAIAKQRVADLKDNIARVERLQVAIAATQTLAGDTASMDDLEALKLDLQRTMESTMGQIEVMVYEGITIDVVKGEDMQVGVDVDCLEEYLDSDECTQLIYEPYDTLLTKFPKLTEQDVKTAEKFYRLRPKNANMGEGDPTAVSDSVLYPTNADGEQYGTVDQGQGSKPFARIHEKWNRADSHIYTAISGVKLWAREPYMPPCITSRYFPFFYFSIYEVDGARAPQSLSAREAKLQDEYAATRSSFRISRERSIPGAYFNAGTMSDEDAKKISAGKREEMLAIKFTSQDQDINKVFAEKPVSKIDPRLYDTQPILADMERMAGVQEAQSAAVTVEKTATEAEIQQAGFSARTSAARDCIEDVLTDMALYTAEICLQTLSPQMVQKMCGPGAFWPQGMPREDILSLVDIDIVAGTTGKPRNRGDREAWATVMPLIKEVQAQIYQYELNPATAPLANALKELIRETMLRMGDDSDPSRFFPAAPAPIPPPPAPVPGAPGADPFADPLSGGAPGAAPFPPAAGPAAGAPSESTFPADIPE